MMTFFPGATCLGGGSNHFGFITKCTVGCHFEFKCVGSVNFFLVLAVALFGLPFKLLSLFGSCLFPIPEPLNRKGGVFQLRNWVKTDETQKAGFARPVTRK